MSENTVARAWALGGLVFAAAMMIMLGLWQIFVGIAAIAEDEIFAVTSGYTYQIDTTAWGWIHLVLGVIVLLAGFSLLGTFAWARVVGIALAILVAINNFLFLPYHPLWSIIVIALAVFVIWALATAPSDQEPSEIPASTLPH